jgi:hypothetical protein
VTAPGSGPAALEHLAGEPALADVQREYPGWQCVQGVSGFFYAEHAATGTQVNGEDPLDLRDQIKAAAARLACGMPGAGSSGSGPAGLL